MRKRKANHTPARLCTTGATCTPGRRSAQRKRWRMALLLVCIIVGFVVLESKAGVFALITRSGDGSRVSDDNNFTAESRDVRGRPVEGVSVFRRSPYVDVFFANCRVTDISARNDNSRIGAYPWPKCPLVEVFRFAKGEIIWKGVLSDLHNSNNPKILGWCISEILETDGDFPRSYYTVLVHMGDAFNEINKNKSSFGIPNQTILSVHDLGLFVHQISLPPGDPPQQSSEKSNDRGQGYVDPISGLHSIICAFIPIVAFIIFFALLFIADGLWVVGKRRFRNGSGPGGRTLIFISSTIGVGSPLALMAILIWWGIRLCR
jgi:hypothetical protein